MEDIQRKLEKILDTKDKIKKAIIKKGIKNVTEVFSTYPKLITQIIDFGGLTEDLNWALIGYKERPQHIETGYNYCKEIHDVWHDNKDITKAFAGDSRLYYFPNILFPSAQLADSLFEGCSNLTYVDKIELNKIKSSNSLFQNCKHLIYLNKLSLASSTSMKSTFNGCELIKEIGEINNPLATDISSSFSNCNNLQKIGKIDFANVSKMRNSFEGCKNLCYLEIHNLGKFDYRNGMLYTLDFSFLRNWGIDNNGITGCKQSLIDSLITYSFDRRKAKYQDLEIKLSVETKNLLSLTEKQQIADKGYLLV